MTPTFQLPLSGSRIWPHQLVVEPAKEAFNSLSRDHEGEDQKCDVHVFADDFQLPLSGSHFGHEGATMNRKSGLSTPSLGITQPSQFTRSAP